MAFSRIVLLFGAFYLLLINACTSCGNPVAEAASYSSGGGTSTEASSSSNLVSSSSVGWSYHVMTSSSSLVANRVCSYTLTNNPILGAGMLACEEKNYKTVTMGTQVWMAENLDFGSTVSGSLVQVNDSNSNVQKYCYDDLDSNCTIYGGLYQWHTAMALPLHCNGTSTDTVNCDVNTPHQGICPSGWHLPTKDEWATLAAWVDTENGGNSNDETTSLKSKELWLVVAQNGTDAYGWSAFPGGYRSNNDFIFQGYSAFWWSSSQDAAGAWMCIVDDGEPELGIGFRDKAYFGVSVRCLMDSP